MIPRTLRSRFSALFPLLAGGMLVSACLSGTGVGGGGASPAGGGETVLEDSSHPSAAPADKAPDDTAVNPGPGGSMPSGTAAPHPLIPVSFNYKAVATYCRFEGNESQAMIWGRIYRKEGDGDEAIFSECADHCRQHFLNLVPLADEGEATKTLTMDEPPDFAFTGEIGDIVGGYRLVLTRKQLAKIGEEPAPVAGATVWKEFRPYADGEGPNHCPATILGRATSDEAIKAPATFQAVPLTK